MSISTTSPFGPDGALRTTIAGQEQAACAAREVEVLPTPEEAFDAAMDLWSLCPEQLQAPLDRVRLREVEQARSAWKKLKARLGR